MKYTNAEAAAIMTQAREKIDRHDAQIGALHDEIEVKVSLGRKVARLKSEIAEARAMQPNFEAELDGVRDKIAKQKTIISKLRAEASELRYAQEKRSKE